MVLLTFLRTVFSGYAQLFRQANGYSIYVLFILLIVYLLNQLCRYALPVVSKQMAQDIHFGDKSCMLKSNESESDSKKCSNLNQTSCESVFLNNTNTSICEYNYNGKGSEYQAVAGPVFILIYTFTGIFISYFADKFQHRRVIILSCCLIFWSVMTLLSGFVNSYWQLVILRFGLGFGEAACTPLATSLITDYFSQELRGAALGIYNWGIYTGYSMSIGIGFPILKNHGWRWVFIVFGIPGIVVGVILFLSVKQPKKEVKPSENTNNQTTTRSSTNRCTSALLVLEDLAKVFLKPTLILLCIAGSIRNAAGYIWGYNYNFFYGDLGEKPDQIAAWLSWVPIVGGLSGSLVGGFVSDRIVKKSEPWKRIWVLVISQLLAVPFLVGVLLLPTPWSYVFLIPSYIFGEMWVGVCLSVVVELVPENLRNSGVGFYFFIISNIGGNMQNLLPPIEKLLQSRHNLTELQSIRTVLFIFYPGEYIIGSLGFLITLFVIKYDLKRMQKNQLMSFAPKTDDENSITEQEEQNDTGVVNNGYNNEDDDARNLVNPKK